MIRLSNFRSNNNTCTFEFKCKYKKLKCFYRINYSVSKDFYYLEFKDQEKYVALGTYENIPTAVERIKIDFKLKVNKLYKEQ